MISSMASLWAEEASCGDNLVRRLWYSSSLFFKSSSYFSAVILFVFLYAAMDFRSSFTSTSSLVAGSLMCSSCSTNSGLNRSSSTSVSRMVTTELQVNALATAGGPPSQDEGFAHGSALPDDFKLWLSRHPGLTIDEAISRYREEQKAKRRRQGPKLH